MNQEYFMILQMRQNLVYLELESSIAKCIWTKVNMLLYLSQNIILELASLIQIQQKSSVAEKAMCYLNQIYEVLRAMKIIWSLIHNA